MSQEAPLILAIETSANAGSTALLRGGTLIAEKRFDPALRGGNVLHPSIAALLEDAGGEPVGLVAVSIGPGSYTGTRIGVVFAKTYAFARGVPLVGVSALEAAALRLHPVGRSAALMAAHPGQVYGAVYDCRDGAPPRVVQAPALGPRETFLAGITEGDRVVEMPPEQAWASDVGRVAWRRAAAGEIQPEPDTLDPLYLQAPAPERK